MPRGWFARAAFFNNLYIRGGGRQMTLDLSSGEMRKLHCCVVVILRDAANEKRNKRRIKIVVSFLTGKPRITHYAKPTVLSYLSHRHVLSRVLLYVVHYIYFSTTRSAYLDILYLGHLLENCFRDCNYNCFPSLVASPCLFTCVNTFPAALDVCAPR